MMLIHLHYDFLYHLHFAFLYLHRSGSFFLIHFSCCNVCLCISKLSCMAFLFLSLKIIEGIGSIIFCFIVVMHRYIPLKSMLCLIQCSSSITSRASNAGTFPPISSFKANPTPIILFTSSTL